VSGRLSFLRHLIFPPRCAGCGACLPPAHDEEPLFCGECERTWERELRAQCPQCHADYPDCDCVPHEMKKAGISHLVKLVPYGEQYKVARHMILSMKGAPRDRLAAFLAKEQSEGVLRALERCECEKKDALILSFPRNKRAVRRYGVDQARELALALSREIEIPYSALLRRRKHTKTQKKLSQKERTLNLVNALALDAVPQARCVILVDDIVTTGASVSAAAGILRAAGVSKIVAVCVAQTQKKK